MVFAKSPRNRAASSRWKLPGTQEARRFHKPTMTQREEGRGQEARLLARLTDARAQVEDALGPVADVLQPLPPVIVGAEEAVAGDVLEFGQLGEGALQLVAGEVEGVVVDLLGGAFEGLEEEADLAEVPFGGGHLLG